MREKENKFRESSGNFFPGKKKKEEEIQAEKGFLFPLFDGKGEKFYFISLLPLLPRSPCF